MNGQQLSEKEAHLLKYDLSIKRFSPCLFESPLKSFKGVMDGHFIPEDEKVLAFIDYSVVRDCYLRDIPVPSFEKAGPREKLYFEPGETVSAIVTCGGLCPGLNSVIKGIVMMNYYRYNNKRTYGIRYGYAGLIKENGYPIDLLTPELVGGIQNDGGTILGSSRGPQDSEKMVDRLVELGVDILYAIGGDGTQKGAMALIEEIDKRGLKIAVVGIPKTIDNDINYIDRSFGTETAFSEACDAINAAHTEAASAFNGVGIVKLMGRDSGFIAANATLATNEVNFCIIPEMDFELEGEKGFLARLERRLIRKDHAVVVVAEGAGQSYVTDKDNMQYDKSGNVKLGDIGLFLKQKIGEYLKEKSILHTIKYIDPSYIIRSCGPTPNDSIFCLQLAQTAVHAGMSGRTSLVVGYLNGRFIHIPMSLATARRKRIDLNSQLWLSVLETTGQGEDF